VPFSLEKYGYIAQRWDISTASIWENGDYEWDDGKLLIVQLESCQMQKESGDIL